MIDIGTKIRLKGEDEPFTIVFHIAGGGEGDVYELRSDSGRARAFKWYHEKISTPERRTRLEALVRRGAPNGSFLWPLGLVEDGESGRFGYVMELRPDGYVDLARLLKGEIERDEGPVVHFAFELANAFMALHTQGLCYRDINFGNAFYHPESGEALICDNDNVGVDGLDQSMVLGTYGFMAPEIMRDSAQPSKYTDRHSLAVLLFVLLVGCHPLEGRRTVGIVEKVALIKHYMLDPLFCFHPDDGANRHLPGEHVDHGLRWVALPARLRKLFTRSFTIGLDRPLERVVDAEWCDALGELEDHFYSCPSCGEPNFVDGPRLRPCPHCQGLHEIPALCVEGRHVVIRDRARVTRAVVHGDYDYRTVVGTVEPHPTIDGLMGLKNSGERPLTYRDARRRTRPLRPGMRASLVPGAEIDLGGRWARVVNLRPDRDCC